MPNSTTRQSFHLNKQENIYDNRSLILPCFTPYACISTEIIKVQFIIVMSSLNLPEYDEHQWQQDMDPSFPFNIDSINYKSPSLPLHFSKRFLPKNLCEAELLNASQCLLQHNTMQNERSIMCSFEISHFEVCRRQRDLRILMGIKTWETQHIISLDKQNRGMYQMGLGRKVSRLEEELERQPSTMPIRYSSRPFSSITIRIM